jgi:hypothetical protein
MDDDYAREIAESLRRIEALLDDGISALLITLTDVSDSNAELAWRSQHFWQRWARTWRQAKNDDKLASELPKNAAT